MMGILKIMGKSHRNANTGKDENRGRGTLKQGTVTKWDPKSKSLKVNTSNKFQLQEEEKEKEKERDINKDTEQIKVQQGQDDKQEHTPNKSTKKWVEEIFGKDSQDNSTNQQGKGSDGEGKGREIDSSPATTKQGKERKEAKKPTLTDREATG